MRTSGVDDVDDLVLVVAVAVDVAGTAFDDELGAILLPHAH